MMLSKDERNRLTVALSTATPEEATAVWTALQQFIDNAVERDDGDPMPAIESAALSLMEKLDAAIAHV